MVFQNLTNMSQFTIIKLKNWSPFHIGTGSEEYHFSNFKIDSDSISSALASIRASIGKSDDLNQFLESFTISSGFPFYKAKLFLPRPNGIIKNVSVFQKKMSEYRKLVKKVEFIELTIWQQLILGKETVIKLEQINNKFLWNESVLCNKIVKSEVHQRVTVPVEENSDPIPFYFNWNFFEKNAGIYFIIDAKDKELDEIITLFGILGDTGIGTDKNIGGGKFEIETSNINIDLPNDSNSVLLLSNYIPTFEEIKSIDLKNSSYELIKRGGYIAGSNVEKYRHLKKSSIFLFKSGSILKTKIPLKGKVVNLKPEWNAEQLHPVFRSGIPFVIPIKTTNDE